MKIVNPGLENIRFVINRYKPLPGRRYSDVPVHYFTFPVLFDVCMYRYLTVEILRGQPGRMKKNLKLKKKRSRWVALPLFGPPPDEISDTKIINKKILALSFAI
jgi:hypothetical protein